MFWMQSQKTCHYHMKTVMTTSGSLFSTVVIPSMNSHLFCSKAICCVVSNSFDSLGCLVVPLSLQAWLAGKKRKKKMTAVAITVFPPWLIWGLCELPLSPTLECGSLSQHTGLAACSYPKAKWSSAHGTLHRAQDLPTKRHTRWFSKAP